MAAERTPGAKPEGDKTAAAGAAAGAAKAAAKGGGGGLNAFLPLIITVVVMPVLAYGMTSYVIVPKLQKSLGLTPAPTSEAASKEGHSGGEEEGGGGHGGGHGEGGAGGAGETVQLSKMLVNVSGTMGSRYLLSSYVISGKGADFPAKFEKNHPKIVDLAGSVLSTKTISDLEKPNVRNLIRSELISAFNSVLGNNAVQDIYITEFAIQ